MVEQVAVNHLVGGSNPSSRAKFSSTECLQWLEDSTKCHSTSDERFHLILAAI